MHISEVIKFPILTEKTYDQMSKGIYTFAVDPRTNRAQVKKTVEFIFEVKVDKVNIINVDKKPKKLGRYEGFTNKVKKAIITLKEGQINLYPDEAESVETESQKKTTSKTSNKKISEAEKRAADKIAAKLAEKEGASIAPQNPSNTSVIKTKEETKKPASAKKPAAKAQKPVVNKKQTATKKAPSIKPTAKRTTHK